MKPHLVIAAFIFTALSSGALAQPAEMEVPGVFGEGIPVHAAVNDQLVLYKQPDLRSRQITIPYKAGWKISTQKRDGLTRVLRAGLLRVTTPDERMHCSVLPSSGPAELVTGETVQYLYYVGEGFGEIQFRGGRCQAEVVEDLAHFELIDHPIVQIWLKVLYADGSSPGWLLHEGIQTRVVDVLF